ncbi:MAG: RNA-directed DNA polymerase [Bacteroidales bacterium]|nr:RNA-directed DNA polymerase [Bacteroidales bacterium]
MHSSDTGAACGGSDPLFLDLVEAYRDARRHKRNTHSQLEFEVDLERNLVQLWHELRNRTYKPSGSLCFVVKSTVKREVFASAFRDRVVHHLYFNYVSPIFERLFIEDSYSCRKGRGTSAGVRRLEHHLRSCTRNYSREAWVLKLDLRGYFMSIDRGRLCGVVLGELGRMWRRRVRAGGRRWCEVVDTALVEWLTRVITSKDPLEGCRRRGPLSDWDDLPESKRLLPSRPGIGLPIGDLTSQLYSNVFLNRLDQYVKRELGFRHYGRYVDDFYVVSQSRAALRAAVAPIGRFVEGCGLLLHPGKVVLVRADRRMAFLGMVVEPWRRRRLSSVTAKGRRTCREWEEQAAMAWQLPPLEQLAVLQTASNVHGSYSGIYGA